jgi:hypothetical protein
MPGSGLHQCRCPARRPRRSRSQGPTVGIFPAPSSIPHRRKISALGCARRSPTRNIRYYAGPGFAQTLEQLAALTQVLPGSGTMQAWNDGGQAREEANAGNYGQAAAHTAMGAGNLALDLLPGGKVLGTILAGIGARTFPWAKRPIAEAMEKAGRSVDEIWRETGLAKGLDGQWRFEIPDEGFRFNHKPGVLDSEGYRVAPLFEHLDHPGARAAYPGLADTQSRLLIDERIPHEGRGFFTPGQIEIEVPSRSFAKAKGIHELQHAVQDLEGFARGGNPLEFMAPGVSPSQAREMYQRLAGEVEASNAKKRMYLTPSERLRMAPQTTEDVPRDQQIVRFKSRE